MQSVSLKRMDVLGSGEVLKPALSLLNDMFEPELVLLARK
jgi:hypothetical protein